MKTILATCLAWLAFAASCVFYGAAVNISVFVGVTGSLLLAASLAPMRNWHRQLTSSPVELLFPLLTIVLLVSSYQLSLSKDSSYVATWALALVPLSFLLGKSLSDHVKKLYGAISVLVLCLVFISAWQLVTAGVRPRLPLNDPNNYGSLIYLLLIPWIHRYLVNNWRYGGLRLRWHLLALSCFFVVFTVLFATHSRTSAVIVVTALCIWLFVGAIRRLSLMPALACFSVAALAFFTSDFLLPSVSENLVATDDLNTGIDIRLALINSALDMFADNPVSGIGIYVFPLLYRFQRSLVDQETAGLFVHNDYVQLMVEGGVLLFVAVACFAIAVINRLLRSLRSDTRSSEFENFGLLLALGGVLAHASVNFIFYSPALAIVIGLTSAMVWRSSPSSAPRFRHIEPRATAVGFSLLLLFGWVSWAYLVLDAYIYAVFENQPGVPFSSEIRNDPENMHQFALLAQQLNPNRGLPVLAEAALLEQRLIPNRNSEFLRQKTLDAYRRAAEVDPWNPLVPLRWFAFVRANPQVSGELRKDESPEALLMTAIAIDPLYVPGIDALVQYLHATNREAAAFSLMRQRVLPWLPLLARLDKSAAKRYLVYLRHNAEQHNDEDLLAALLSLEKSNERIREKVTSRWFFNQS